MGRLRFNVNHRFFQIWRSLSHSILSQNSIHCLHWTELGFIGNLRERQTAGWYRICKKKKKIIFSNEAHIHLGGQVNEENCRIWAQKVHTWPYRSQCLRMTTWWGLWNGSIIGPYFFDNEDSFNPTANGDTYRTMITVIFIVFVYLFFVWILMNIMQECTHFNGHMHI